MATIGIYPNLLGHHLVLTENNLIKIEEPYTDYLLPICYYQIFSWNNTLAFFSFYNYKTLYHT